MKQETTVFYVLRLALILLVITAIVAAALADVNSITRPIIDELTAQKTQAAIEAVLPGGGKAISFPATDSVAHVYQGSAGYAVEVTPSGFDGTITMMVGIDYDGCVLGIDIIDHSETAGLGAVSAADTAAGNAFRSQFIGMSGNVSVSKDGGEVDALTGATITSRGVCAGINAALECVAAMG